MSRENATLRLVASAAGTATLAALGVLTLNLSSGSPALPPAAPPTPFALLTLILASSGVLWLILLGMIALVGRLWLATWLFAIIVTFVAIVNSLKLQYRLEPLYPSDYKFASHGSFILDSLPGMQKFKLALLLIALSGVFMMIARLRGSRSPSPFGESRGGLIITTRVLGCGVSIVLTASLISFNDDGNPIRRIFEMAGAEWQPRAQVANYSRNGFVPAFLYNIHADPMERPAGYSRERLDAIVGNYTRVADQINKHRSAGFPPDVNVVLVLSESFTDPHFIPDLEMQADPIPFIRDTMERAPSGLVRTSGYGGGTANMEFSALTGHSLELLSPQMNTPYQQLVPQQSTYPSAVQFFSNNGYRTAAIHPYDGRLYMRTAVYDRFNFDDAIFEERMSSRKRISPRGFISDASAFKEVSHQISKSRRPLFANLVTIQNHVPYGDIYPDPVVVNEDGDPEKRQELGGYLRGLAHTDVAIKDWLLDLKSSPEKTVVLFYGDHQPAVWSEQTIRRSGTARMHQTDFFIWKNFGKNQAVDLGVVEPSDFLGLILEAMEAPVPPYVALLDTVRGLRTSVPETSLSGRDQMAEAAEDYRLVQYDFSVGNRYAVVPMFETIDSSHDAISP